MRLKLDENLSRQLKPMLQKLGHDVDTAADEGLLSQPDNRVAEVAAATDRMLLTLDLDFSDIRQYPPGSHPGIILFRPQTLGPVTVNQFVCRFVAETDLDALKLCLVVVTADRARIRAPNDD